MTDSIPTAPAGPAQSGDSQTEIQAHVAYLLSQAKNVLLLDKFANPLQNDWSRYLNAVNTLKPEATKWEYKEMSYSGTRSAKAIADWIATLPEGEAWELEWDDEGNVWAEASYSRPYTDEEKAAAQAIVDEYTDKGLTDTVIVWKPRFDDPRGM